MMPSALAMHMSNELLSVPMAVATTAAALAVLAVAARQSRKNLDIERLPLMGVMGAFVFAAQMINFSLPGLGTSGHLGGAVLLAILLGPANAIVTMSAILIIQCLLFQDGGLLALGCNIINMGIVPAVAGLAVYRLVLAGSAACAWRQYLAAWLACLVGVTAGAALVPVEATLSGVVQVPLGEFLGVMVGVHLLIAIVEGLITFAVLAYLRRTRPSALGLESPDTAANTRLSRPALALSIFLTAILLSGVVSWFASQHPDGLEWTWQKLADKYAVAPAGAADPVVAQTDHLQQSWTPMPDYNLRLGWLSLAGVAGTFATLAVLLVGGRLLKKTPLPGRDRVARRAG